MTEPLLCSRCGEPAAESQSAVCNVCERRFHLRLTNEAGGKECGEVWINEQYLWLEFACFSCLGRPPAPSGAAEPPVGGSH